MKPTKHEMLDLISRMEDHRARGGSPFDCPSRTATPDQKADLQSAINNIFDQQTKYWDQANEH